MATNRDYKAEYERRKARASKRGYKSPREETQYQAAQRKREKKQSLNRYRQINETKRRKAAEERKRTKVKETEQLRQRKARVITKFGLKVTSLNRLREQNRNFSANTKSPRLLYNLALDQDVNNWSDQRIGYIRYYNEVFVNPKKLRTVADRQRQAQRIEKWDLFADYQEIFDFGKSGNDKKRKAR